MSAWRPPGPARVGTENADTIDGLGGADIINTRGGDDIIRHTVSQGPDTIEGGSHSLGDTLEVTDGAAQATNFVVGAEADGGVDAGHIGVSTDGGTTVAVDSIGVEDFSVLGLDGDDSLDVRGEFTNTDLDTTTISFDGGTNTTSGDTFTQTGSNAIANLFRISQDGALSVSLERASLKTCSELRFSKPRKS